MKWLYKALLFGLAVFSGCKKESGITYPSTYLEHQYRNTTPVRMYSRGGEIKNDKLLQTFIQSYDNYDYYKLKGVSESVSTGDEVVLENGQKAIFMNGGSPFEFDLQVTGKDLWFTSTEERTFRYGENDVYAENMLIAVSKYKPLIYDKAATAFAGGYEYSYKTKDRLYAHQKANTLEFPRLLYTIKTGTSKDFQLKTLFIDNEFDPSVIATLQDTDTLVVQEFVRVYRKK